MWTGEGHGGAFLGNKQVLQHGLGAGYAVHAHTHVFTCVHTYTFTTCMCKIHLAVYLRLITFLYVHFLKLGNLISDLWSLENLIKIN